jgi:hypothetical protein
VILIQLLAAGKGAPWDQLVNVGIAGVIGDVLVFQADQVGLEIILRGCA